MQRSWASSEYRQGHFLSGLCKNRIGCFRCMFPWIDFFFHWKCEVEQLSASCCVWRSSCSRKIVLEALYHSAIPICKSSIFFKICFHFMFFLTPHSQLCKTIIPSCPLYPSVCMWCNFFLFVWFSFFFLFLHWTNLLCKLYILPRQFDSPHIFW